MRVIAFCLLVCALAHAQTRNIDERLVCAAWGDDHVLADYARGADRDFNVDAHGRMVLPAFHQAAVFLGQHRQFDASRVLIKWSDPTFPGWQRIGRHTRERLQPVIAVVQSVLKDCGVMLGVDQSLGVLQPPLK